MAKGSQPRRGQAGVRVSSRHESQGAKRVISEPVSESILAGKATYSIG